MTTDSFLDHKKSKFLNETSKNWNLFYKRNLNNFFKDRHWTDSEFHELSTFKNLLEIGCGHGSFIFPLLHTHPNLSIHCCDFSPKAIELVKSHSEYDPSKIHAFVCDVTIQDSLKLDISPESLDIISCIFVFSAMQPLNMPNAVQNLHSVLQKDGMIIFRDYAVDDLAMKRFKPESRIDENLYFRQDGTLSYFFSIEYLTFLFTSSGLFKIVEIEYIHKKIVNRKKELEMDRIFIQAKFIKL